VALAEVLRFTGRNEREVVDLVRAGVLTQIPGQRRCEIPSASLRTWLAGEAHGELLDLPIGARRQPRWS